MFFFSLTSKKKKNYFVAIVLSIHGEFFIYVSYVSVNGYDYPEGALLQAHSILSLRFLLAFGKIYLFDADAPRGIVLFVCV